MYDPLYLAEVVTALVAIGSFLTAGTAAGTAAAIVGAQFIASTAYTAYTAYSTYSSQKDASKKAADAQRRAELDARERNSRRNFRSAVLAKRTVYGRDRLGGAYIFADNPNDEDAILVVSIADHEIEEFESFWMMNEEIQTDGTGRAIGTYSQNLWIWPFRGAPGQDVGAKLQSLGCTTVSDDDKFEGTACLVIRTRNLLVDHPDVDAHFNAVIKGKNDIFDPRTTLTGYTDNAALCAADYMETYMGFSRSRIDQEELKASADVCDESVELRRGGTEKRYTVNGVVNADQEFRTVISDLAQAMAGSIAFTGGGWNIVAGRYKTPETSFNTDDIVSEFEYTYRGAAKDVPNVGKGTIKSPDFNWQSVGIPEYVDQESLDKADGERREIDVSLPFTNSLSMAQRICKIIVKRAQMEERASLMMKPSALLVKTTDTASFTLPRHGITNKVYEIRDFSTRYSTSSDGVRFDCNVLIVEYGPDIFEWDALEEKIPKASSVTIGSTTGTIPTNINVSTTATHFVTTWTNPATGTVTNTEVEITGVDTASFGSHTKTYYKIHYGNTTNSGTSKSLTRLMRDKGLEIDRDLYQFHSVRIRTHFADGSKSVWVEHS